MKLVASLFSILQNIALTLLTLASYPGLAVVVSIDNLGDIAIRTGLYHYQSEIMIMRVLILIVIVKIIQLGYNSLSPAMDQVLNKIQKKLTVNSTILILDLFLLDCTVSTSEDTIIRVDAASTPHAHILRVINDDLFTLNCVLEIIELKDDYVIQLYMSMYWIRIISNIYFF